MVSNHVYVTLELSR